MENLLSIEDKIFKKYISSKQNLTEKNVNEIKKKTLKELQDLYLEKRNMINHIKELDALISIKEKEFKKFS